MKGNVYKNTREFVLAAVTAMIGITALVIAELLVAGNTALQYNIELWIEGCSVLDFFFPLFVTIPFTWRIYFERKDGFLNYVSVRINRRKYLRSKLRRDMIIVFLMVFVIYYTGLSIAVFCFKPTVIVEDDFLFRYIWGSIQAKQPLVFGFFWCMWKGLIGAIIYVFGYCIALLADNVFVIAFAPFLYCTIENFVTGTLGLEQYSICTSYILNRLSPKVMKTVHYCAGALSFVIMGSVIVLVWAYRKKQVESSEKYH